MSSEPAVARPTTRLYRLREPGFPPRDRGRACAPCGAAPSIPGVICPVCGATWAAGLERLPVELPADHALRRRKTWPAPLEESRRIAAEVAADLKLPPGTKLQPGTQIGLLRLRCRRSTLSSFEWPALGLPAMQQAAVNCFRDSGLTGWHTAPVTVSARGPAPPPDLYELFVDGRGGRAITDPPMRQLSECSACGHVRYDRPVITRFELDPAEWDGSDFLRFDPPFHGYAYVTERAKRAFEHCRLSNYDLVPIEEVAFAGLLLMTETHLLFDAGGAPSRERAEATRADVAATYDRLSRQEQVAFLAVLAHLVTLAMAGLYGGGPQEVHLGPDSVVGGLNEIERHITWFLREAIDDVPERVTGNQVANVFTWPSRDALQPALNRLLEMAKHWLSARLRVSEE